MVRLAKDTVLGFNDYGVPGDGVMGDYLLRCGWLRFGDDGNPPGGTLNVV